MCKWTEEYQAKALGDQITAVSSPQYISRNIIFTTKSKPTFIEPIVFPSIDNMRILLASLTQPFTLDMIPLYYSYFRQFCQWRCSTTPMISSITSITDNRIMFILSNSMAYTALIISIRERRNTTLRKE